MNYPFLQLRFITESDNAGDDHLIDIRKVMSDNGSNGFSWTYRDKNRNQYHMMVFRTKEEVLEALRQNMMLLSWDTEPFHSLQILAPGYPTAMIALEDVPDCFTTISDFLSMMMDNWPVQIPAQPWNQIDLLAQNMLTDDEEEEASVPHFNGSEETETMDGGDNESTSTDSSMPSLVSLSDLNAANIILSLNSHREPNSPVNRRQTQPVEPNAPHRYNTRSRTAQERIRRVFTRTPTGVRVHTQFL